MPGPGAPLGNKNGLKTQRQWTDTMKRVLAENSSEKLRAAVEAVVDAAIHGDISAANHIADRIDGKVKQVIVHEGDDDQPLVIHLAAGAALREKIRGILQRPVERLVNGEDNDAAA